MSNGNWRLLACDRNREQLGVLTGWQQLRLTLRHNQVGSWSLHIPPERTPTGWPDQGSRLVLVRDDRIIASGQWDDRQYAWSADPDSENVGGGKYVLAGDTDLGRLAYHLIYPTPGQPWGQQVNNHWVYPSSGTDTAEEVARVTVNWQAGSLALDTAPQPRQVAGLRLGTSAGLGSQTRIVERFTPLLDALRKVLDPDGLQMGILDDLAGNLDFTIRATRDRTDSVVFAPAAGNVRELVVRDISPVTSVALVAGVGEEAARELVEYIDPAASWPAWGRRETLVDQRGVPTEIDGTPTTPAERAEEYAKAADEQFQSDGWRRAVAVTVIDTPVTRWGRDYQLGDLVTAITPHGPVTDRITEVDITVDATGLETITSVIGDTETTTGSPLAATVRAMQRRISRLESI